MKSKLTQIPGFCLLLAAANVATSADMLDLSTECEEALALSAGPEHLRENAGVYIMGKGGYELRRASSNGYHCIVERNHPESIIPQCFDAASRDANLATVLNEGRMLARGASFEEVATHRLEQQAAGRLQTATRPGVVYMVSDYNYIFVDGNDQLLKVAPHVMFHAPNLSNDDIASSPAAAMSNPGVPFVTAEGPHGFMTSFTHRAADTSAVIAACAGQLPDREDLRPFPPVATP